MTVVPLEKMLELVAVNGIEARLYLGDALSFFQNDLLIVSIKSDNSSPRNVDVHLSHIYLQDGICQMSCACWIPLPSELSGRIDDYMLTKVDISMVRDWMIVFHIEDGKSRSMVEEGGLSFKLPDSLVSPEVSGGVAIFTHLYLPGIESDDISFLHSLLRRFARQAEDFATHIAFEAAPHSPEVS